MTNTEIERKYLLRDDSWRSLVTARHEIKQGYLALGGGNTVRIRLKDDKAYLTVKSHPEKDSITRFEWEHEISPVDFHALFPYCVSGAIEKTRYLVPLSGTDLVIEIDEFHGAHSGLVLAEIELPDEHTALRLPSFIGKEVTNDPRYYNSWLSANPAPL